MCPYKATNETLDNSYFLIMLLYRFLIIRKSVLAFVDIEAFLDIDSDKNGD